MSKNRAASVVLFSALLNFLVNATFPDDFPDRVGRREHGAAKALRVLDDVDPQHAG
ncbi:hypothetical protein C8R44DRAFT_881423 [Mycena epipterygia]|nr:hypothetical protein C8R44DRAFT_881423 [Mycena epipterygia]